MTGADPAGPAADRRPGSNAAGSNAAEDDAAEDDAAGCSAAAPGDAGQVRLTAWVRGRVQGVGFRWWVRSAGLEFGLVGFAENLLDGRVKVVAEGDRANCERMLARLEGPGAPGTVVQVTHRWDAAGGDLSGFAER